MAFRLLSRASTTALALLFMLGACSGGPENSRDSASSHTEIENAGSAGKARAETHTGAAGRSSKPSSTASGGSDDDPAVADAGSDSAGMGGAAGDAGEPPPPCDLEGNCSSDGHGARVTCGVESWFECEFTGFVGATAEVGWGERAVIGTACCGACECVPVEVYYDGARCWQGIPQCDGELLNPHAPTTPNPSFTVPSDVWGTFYLGSGGYGGSGGGAASSDGGAAQGEAGASITPQGGNGGAAGGAF